MVRFETVVRKFGTNADKTGWVYIEIPPEIAGQLKPGYRRSFRVKGTIDKHKIEQTSLLPAGGGSFILPFNQSIRKGINKSVGATVVLKLTEDGREMQIDHELMLCLEEEPVAMERFKKLTPSHQRYFSKWVSDAKTIETRANRIARTVNAMLNNLGFGEAMRS